MDRYHTPARKQAHAERTARERAAHAQRRAQLDLGLEASGTAREILDLVATWCPSLAANPRYVTFLAIQPEQRLREILEQTLCYLGTRTKAAGRAA